MTAKTLDQSAHNEYGSLSLDEIGRQDHDRMIEAPVTNVYVHEKIIINLILLWQPQDAAWLELMILRSCPRHYVLIIKYCIQMKMEAERLMCSWPRFLPYKAIASHHYADWS